MGQNKEKDVENLAKLFLVLNWVSFWWTAWTPHSISSNPNCYFYFMTYQLIWITLYSFKIIPIGFLCDLYTILLVWELSLCFVPYGHSFLSPICGFSETKKRRRKRWLYTFIAKPLAYNTSLNIVAEERESKINWRGRRTLCSRSGVWKKLKEIFSSFPKKGRYYFRRFLNLCEGSASNTKAFVIV